MRTAALALIFGLLSGILAAIAIAPSPVLAAFGDSAPSLGILGWLAFVPVMLAIGRARSAFPAMLAGGVFGMTWLLLTCAWIIRVHWAGWLLTGIAWLLYGAMLAWVLWLIFRKAPRLAVLGWPAAWVFGDWLHASAGIKFPWLFAAYTQIDADPWLAQTADLLGVWLPNFIVLAVNAAIAVAILDRMGHPKALRIADAIAGPEAAQKAAARGWRDVAGHQKWVWIGVGGLLIVAHVYGAIRVATVEISPGPVVALMQPNIPLGLQREQTATEDNVFRLVEIMDAVAETDAVGTREFPSDTLAAAKSFYPFARDKIWVQRAVPGPVDLVVMPESGYNFSVQEYLWARDEPRVLRSYEFYRWMVRLTDPLFDRQRRHGWPMLWSTFEWQPGLEFDFKRAGTWFDTARQQNCSVLVNANGTVEKLYAKVELVPVGEYVPLREYTSITRELTKTISGLEHPPDLLPGETAMIFSLSRPEKNGGVIGSRDGGDPVPATEFKFGSAICFETNFPYLARKSAANGATFLLVQSNDGWFIPSAELMQVWIGTRYRAIESRLGIARAVNSGVSGVVNPDGSVRRFFTAEIDGTTENHGFAGALVTDVPQGSGRSLYVIVGDVWPLMCGAFASVFFLAGFASHRRIKREIRKARADAKATANSEAAPEAAEQPPSAGT